MFFVLSKHAIERYAERILNDKSALDQAKEEMSTTEVLYQKRSGKDKWLLFCDGFAFVAYSTNGQRWTVVTVLTPGHTEYDRLVDPNPADECRACLETVTVYPTKTSDSAIARGLKWP